DEQSEALAVLFPQEVGETVHLDGLEALEKENDRQIGVGGRIPVENRLNIVSCVDDDLGRFPVSTLEQLTYCHGRHNIVRKLVGQDEAERRIEILVIEDAGIHITGQQRLFLCQLESFVGKLAPDIVEHSSVL